MGVAVAAQSGPEGSAAFRYWSASGRLQSTQVDRFFTMQRLGDAARRDLADARKLTQGAGLRAFGQLLRGNARRSRSGVAKRTDPIGWFAGPLEQERDPL